MAKFLYALLLAVGGGTWVYSHFMKTTGSLVQRSLMAATVSAIGIFIVAAILFAAIGV